MPSRVLLPVVLIAAAAASGEAQSLPLVRVVDQTTDIVRWHPRAPGDVIATVEPGTTLEVLDQDKDYIWVVTPRDGHGVRRGGWIPAKRVEPVQETAVVVLREAELPPPAAAPSAAETRTTADEDASGAGNARPNVGDPRAHVFDDVLFERDRFTLNPDAERTLERALIALGDDRLLRLTIEGHTCSLGTPEYNLTLGDRRAAAVLDYLVNRGVAASRLQKVSVGEERPKHDNSKEETRRLNRRVVLVPQAQP